VKQEELITSLKEIERLASSCLAALGGGGRLSAKAKTASKANPTSAKQRPSPDFRQPIRHFMNIHAKGMNGQQRFALVVAYFSKGKPETKVQLETIKSAWTKMQKLLGKFNTGYAVWAKDRGWVDSHESKVYVVTPNWTEILNHNA